jgi:hypothetical protein
MPAITDVPNLKLPNVEGLSPREAALLYGSHGWPVFPCEAANHDAARKTWSKKPHPMLRNEEVERGEGGWKLATTDPDKINEWWEQDPSALIGLVPGMHGAVVIDADGADGIKALYDEAGNFDLASTPTSRTPGKGGGLHVWFDRRALVGTIGNGSLKKVPGEARADRGYVIVPPSFLPDGGTYAFTGHTYDLMQLPGWASDLLPWESEGSIRASIADVTRGDEQEWLIAKGAATTDEDAREAIRVAVSDITTATPGDFKEGRHPTAVKYAASLLSRAQKREFAINLLEALGEIRDALLSVKPEGGGDFDRFVSDAIALRVAEDRLKSESHLDISLLRKEEEFWEDPIDLHPGHRGVTRPFPTQQLPDVMRRMVQEVAKATQMSETIPALAALGCASAATAGGFVTSLNAAWQEGLSLYLIGVADPSERKTAGLKPFIDSIRHAASEWTESVAQDRAAWEAEGASVEARMKEAKKIASTPEGQAEIVNLTLAAEDHEREGQRFVVPNGIIHADPTQEALIAEMAKQHGVAFLASSEGAFIANLAGRYTKTDRNDFSLVNEAYSRSFIRSTRVTRGDTVVATPHLAIVSFIQPRIAEQLAHPDFEATGFLSRVLYAHPPSIVGQRETSLARYSPLYGVAVDGWSRRMGAIFSRGWGREEDPHVLMLHPDATEMFEEWWRKCERLAPTDPWWGKAHGNTVRVASVLELVENPGATRVSVESVDAAITVVEFFAEERALMRANVLDGEGATYQMSAEMRKALMQIAKRWDAIQERGGQMSVRELGRWMRMSKSDAFALAEEMVEQGWLKEGEAGRVDSVTYLPHPSIPEASQALTIASTSVASVAQVSRNKGSSVAPKEPATTRENGASVASVADFGGVVGIEGGFSSSCYSSNIHSTGEVNSDSPLIQEHRTHARRMPPPEKRDTRDTYPETSTSERANGRDTSPEKARHLRDTRDTSREKLEAVLDEAVETALADASTAKALDDLMPEETGGSDGHTNGRPRSYLDDLDDNAPAKPVDLPQPVIAGVPRCRVCKAILLTEATGKKRCTDHGYQG